MDPSVSLNPGRNPWVNCPRQPLRPRPRRRRCAVAPSGEDDLFRDPFAEFATEQPLSRIRRSLQRRYSPVTPTRRDLD